VFPLFGSNPTANRALWTALFVGSAALAAGLLRTAWQAPEVGVVVLVIIAGTVGYRWYARRRMTRLLHSGDVGSVLERWHDTFERVPYAETMGPLLRATAFAAYGWVDAARTTLATAERGPAWEAAIEHRLFLDTMLLTFEGDREGALEHAQRLERLPLPDDEGLGDRAHLLRDAITALARAFAHEARPGDGAVLEQASEASPLIFWAMRYGAAVVAIDEGRDDYARVLISDAPSWPEESAFRGFQTELEGRLAPPLPS
jgi:hypothetical protein